VRHGNRAPRARSDRLEDADGLARRHLRLVLVEAMRQIGVLVEHADEAWALLDRRLIHEAFAF